MPKKPEKSYLVSALLCFAMAMVVSGALVGLTGGDKATSIKAHVKGFSVEGGSIGSLLMIGGVVLALAVLYRLQPGVRVFANSKPDLWERFKKPVLISLVCVLLFLLGYLISHVV